MTKLEHIHFRIMRTLSKDGVSIFYRGYDLATITVKTSNKILESEVDKTFCVARDILLKLIRRETLNDTESVILMRVGYICGKYLRDKPYTDDEWTFINSNEKEANEVVWLDGDPYTKINLGKCDVQVEKHAMCSVIEDINGIKLQLSPEGLS